MAARLIFAAGLSQHNVLSANIYERVSMPTARADEMAPLIVNFGLNGGEHDFQLAAFTLPHGRIPLDGRSSLAQLTAIETGGHSMRELATTGRQRPRVNVGIVGHGSCGTKALIAALAAAMATDPVARVLCTDHTPRPAAAQPPAERSRKLPKAEKKREERMARNRRLQRNGTNGCNDA